MNGHLSLASLSSHLRDLGRNLADCLACYANVH